MTDKRGHMCLLKHVEYVNYELLDEERMKTLPHLHT